MRLTVFLNARLKPSEHHSIEVARGVLKHVEKKYPNVDFKLIDASHELSSLDHNSTRKQMKENGLSPDETAEIESWFVNQVQREANPSNSLFIDFRNVDLRFAEESLFNDFKMFGFLESLREQMGQHCVVVSQALDDEAFASPQGIKWFSSPSFDPERTHWHDHYAVFTPFAFHKDKSASLDATRNSIDETKVIEDAAGAVEKMIQVKQRSLEYARFKYLH
ncbi:MAG: hypothetical protein V1834_00580 [Candidatus Micrarchaeota archaeon]